MSFKVIENIELYDSKEINFIKIFFKILVVFTIIAILCLFVIPVNDSITYNSGEILSKNPEIDYKAPFEVIPQRAFVSKGDVVKKGDTLLYITNASLDKDFSTTQGEYTNLSQQTKSLDIDKLNVDEKIAFFEKEKELKSNQYKINRRKTFSDLNGTNNKLSLLKEQELLKKRKLNSDSLMYAKEVISLVDLRASYEDYLNTRNQVIENQNTVNQLRIQIKTLENQFNQESNNLNIQISDLKASQGRLEQQKETVNTKLETQEKSIDFIQSELNKQYIVSDIDGVVTSLFNETQNFNFINKGESLVTVSPTEELFYARAKVQEKDLKYISVGQASNIKLDAYYYYKYGAIKGIVTYIPERKDRNGDFYVTIDLQDDKNLDLKSGYSINGDIILNKMQLGSFIVKKLFEKYNTDVIPKTPENMSNLKK